MFHVSFFVNVEKGGPMGASMLFVHSVHLHSKCTLWKVFVFKNLSCPERSSCFYYIRRTLPDTIDGTNKYHPQYALALQVHTMEGNLL
jgi:hypothetical protein